MTKRGGSEEVKVKEKERGKKGWGLDAVPNFRDVGVSVGKGVRHGLLFRSAAQWGATAKDIERMLDNEGEGGLGIHAIVDFREHKEEIRTQGSHQNLIGCVFSFPKEHDSYKTLRGMTITQAREWVASTEKTLQDSPNHVRDLNSVGSETNDCACVARFRKEGLVKYYLPVASRKNMALGLFATVPLSHSLYVAGMFALGLVWNKEYKAVATKHMISLLDNSGLMGLYKLFVGYGQAEIVGALKVITISVCDSKPVLLNCFHGKDRTGVLVALILKMLGISNEDIAEDYHKSEPFAATKVARDQFISSGLMDESWVLAPKELMLEFLQFLDTKYGGVDTYCDKIGFDAEWRALLRATLRPTK